MDARKRIERHIQGLEVDRIPAVGGWNLGIDSLCSWAGLSRQEYLQDMARGVIRANRGLGVDTMVSSFVIPDPADELRVGHIEELSFASASAQDLVERAKRIPSTREGVEASVDTRALGEQLEAKFHALVSCGDFPYLYTDWWAPANFSLYSEYGYMAFFEAVGIYPEAVERIWWEDGILSRMRNEVKVELMNRYGMLPMLFCGDDICNGSGPMVSPEFLKAAYWPHVAYSLQPFVDEGIRLIAHCDGNVMPLIDDMLASGFTGFQGYQYEDGFDPFLVRQKALAYHQNPLFVGGLSVTRTLVQGGLEDVIEDIDYLYDATCGGQGMLLFTSNVSGIDCDPALIRDAYAYARALRPTKRADPPAQRPWPFAVNHPEWV